MLVIRKTKQNKKTYNPDEKNKNSLWLNRIFFHCHNISAKLAISSSSLAVSKIILKRVYQLLTFLGFYD